MPAYFDGTEVDATRINGTGLDTLVIDGAEVWAINSAPWHMEGAILKQSFLVNNTSSHLLFGVRFDDTGTKMYVGVRSSQYWIHQYSLSTAWDTSTAALQHITTLSKYCTFFVFNGSGTKIITYDPYGTFVQYNLLTAWDTSSINSSSTVTVDDQIDSGSGSGFDFNSNGTKMYMANYKDGIYEYSLSTAFDPATATYNNNKFVLPIGIDDIYIGDNDTRVYIVNRNDNTVDHYVFSTPGNISTAGSLIDSHDFSGLSGSGERVTFGPNGEKMYMISSNYSENDSIYEFDLV